jgi:hypothetical protein
MATLIGKVQKMRQVSGEYKDGKRKGEAWEFLSFDIADDDSGFIWNCQLPSEDESYQAVAADSLVNHRVQAIIMGASPSEWTGKDGTKNKDVRVRITDMQDLGRVKRAVVAEAAAA